MVERTFIALDNEVLRQVNPDGSLGPAIVNNSSVSNGTVFEYQAGFAAQSITLDDVSPSDPDVFDDDQSAQHTIVTGQGGGIVGDGTAVESESRIDLRALDGDGNPTGPTIQVFVFSQNGDFSDVWGVGLTAELVPGTQYVKVSGSNNGDSDYTQFVPCFTAGTQIRTPTGLSCVETLQVGDLVWTPQGARSITWCGRVTADGTGPLAPIEFAAGVLGNTRALRVSPQHRMVISGWQAEILFGLDQVLVPAVHLLGCPGVRRVTVSQVDYVHFLCGDHAIVEAEGIRTESFYPGDMALAALASETRAELLTLFPDLGADPVPTLALPTLTGREAQVLARALPA